MVTGDYREGREGKGLFTGYRGNREGEGGLLSCEKGEILYTSRFWSLLRVGRKQEANFEPFQGWHQLEFVVA